MPHVLIAGCGYVGTAAARSFRQAGWRVTGWVRTDLMREREGEQEISLKAVDITSLDAVVRNSFAADVVVHCASSGGDSYQRVYRDGVGNLINSFPRARIIFTSSTSVYAQQDRSIVTEESRAEPDSEQGRTLRQAEEIVLQSGGIVLRVAGIYGPGRSFLLRSVINGTAIMSDRTVNQIHRDDVAAAILYLAQCRAVEPPRIFNVVDDTPSARAEILQWLAARLNLPVPGATGAPQRKARRSDKHVSNAKLRALGWSPAYPSYREAFDQSVIPALERYGT